MKQKTHSVNGTKLTNRQIKYLKRKVGKKHISIAKARAFLKEASKSPK